MGQRSKKRSRSPTEILSSGIKGGTLLEPISHAPAHIFHLIGFFSPLTEISLLVPINSLEPPSSAVLPQVPAARGPLCHPPRFPTPSPQAGALPTSTSTHPPPRHDLPGRTGPAGPPRSPFLSSCLTVRSGSSSVSGGPEGPSMFLQAGAPPPLPLPVCVSAEAGDVTWPEADFIFQGRSRGEEPCRRAGGGRSPLRLGENGKKTPTPPNNKQLLKYREAHARRLPSPGPQSQPMPLRLPSPLLPPSPPNSRERSGAPPSGAEPSRARRGPAGIG